MASRFSLLVLFLLVACSKHSSHQDAMLFYGECRVEVVSKTKGAHILIDGIPMGHDEAKVNIPCGEKQITVEKEGYMPYREYITVTKDEGIRVKVELEKPKKHSHYALSSTLIEQLRKGEKLIDPTASKEVQAMQLAQANAVAAASPVTASASATGGGASAAAPEAGQDTVDYWR